MFFVGDDLQDIICGRDAGNGKSNLLFFCFSKFNDINQVPKNCFDQCLTLCFLNTKALLARPFLALFSSNVYFDCYQKKNVISDKSRKFTLYFRTVK